MKTFPLWVALAATGAIAQTHPQPEHRAAHPHSHLALAQTATQPAQAGGLHAHTHGAPHIYQAYKALREGGVVIFMRHAKTKVQGKDDLPGSQVNESNCAQQRNLSEAGKESAKEIAQSWTLLKLPKIDRVEYSPYCRTRETAQLAFGANGFPIAANPELLTTPQSMSQLGERLKKAFSNAPTPGTNRVMVGHVFSALQIGHQLEEGESLIAKPDGKGGYQIMGRLTATQWGDLTRDVLAYGDRVFELSQSHGHHGHGKAHGAAHGHDATKPASTNSHHKH